MANLIVTFGKVSGLGGTSVPLEDGMAGITEQVELFAYSHGGDVVCPPGYGVLTLYAEADCWWIAAGNNDDANPETSERRRFLPTGIEKQYAVKPGCVIRAVAD